MDTNPSLDHLSQQPEKKTSATLILDENEVNVVMRGLSEMPHRIADPVIRGIIKQLQDQFPNK